MPIFLHPPAEPVGATALSDFRLVEQVGRFMDVTVGLATPGFQRACWSATPTSSSSAPRPAARSRCWPTGSTRPTRLATTAGRPAAVHPPGRGEDRPAALPARMRYENKIAEPPTTYLRRIYADTANSSPANHLANLEVMGADHIMFGTDSPPLSTPLEEAIELVESLPISAEDKRRVFEDNARELFKLDGAAL